MNNGQTFQLSVALDDLGIPRSDYDYILLVSYDAEFQVYLKQLPYLCFINNCFEFQYGLPSWKANMNVQLVFNH